MSINNTIRRIYRETIASYGNEGISRAEAIESATATVMVEVNAGRLSLDFERAVRAELRRADEQDGRDADAIITRLSYGQVPITEDDLDVVVTLGKGLRKVWREVTGDDLVQMRELRRENYLKAKGAFDEFAANVNRLLPVLFEYRTVGEAWRNGGFPPADSKKGAA